MNPIIQHIIVKFHVPPDKAVVLWQHMVEESKKAGQDISNIPPKALINFIDSLVANK